MVRGLGNATGNKTQKDLDFMEFTIQWREQVRDRHIMLDGMKGRE